MPYKDINDPKLPDRIKEMPEEARNIFVSTFNQVFADCQNEQGEDCEGKAMAIANTAVSEQMEAGEEKPEDQLPEDMETGNKPEDDEMEAAAGDVDLKLPDHMIDALKRGLKAHEEGRTGDGLKPETVRAARRMVETGITTPEKVRLAVGWLARHRSDWQKGEDDKRNDESQGFSAWLLWGDDGTERGRKWWERKRDELEKATEMSFAVLDLSDVILHQGKPFAALAAVDGLVDRFGREVGFADENMEEYASNTNEAIRLTKEQGMPGLPIDTQKHEKGIAAGWIIEAVVSKLRLPNGRIVDAISLVAEWTKQGIALIRSKEMANFSPNVNLTTKRIIGGSLTNWPAQNINGVPMLPAIQLEQQTRQQEETDMKDKDEEITLSDDALDRIVTAVFERAAARATGKDDDAELGNGEMWSQMLNLDGVTDRIAQTMQENAQRVIEQAQLEADRKVEKRLFHLARQRNIEAAVIELTQGTNDVPYGLPIHGEQLEEMLKRLPHEQLEPWLGTLREFATNGRTAFNELGHGKKAETKKELPKHVADDLRSGKLKVVQLSDPILKPILGDITQYDLSEFTEAK